MAEGEDAIAWVALRAVAGDVLGRRLVERFGAAAAVRAAPAAALVAAGARPHVAAALGAAAAEHDARRELDRIAGLGARLVCLADAEYPPPLRQVHDAPLHLIAQGEPLAPGPAIAIVGARRATSYGIDAARALAEGLVQAGVAVVSGLARGVDGAAHEGALAGRGCTIAVLGSGIDVVYPPEHTELAARIRTSGTLISERPVGTPPLPAHFPARNRILAGMTQGTIVIEAAERSGSLITARLANEQGREVFAVPGRIDSPLSHGAHLLIREGATLVRDVDDVLAEIAPALRRAPGAAAAGTPSPGRDEDARLLAVLAGGPATVDELIAASGLGAPEILARLLDFELQGLVQRVSGRQFQLTGRIAGGGVFQ